MRSNKAVVILIGMMMFIPLFSLILPVSGIITNNTKLALLVNDMDMLDNESQASIFFASYHGFEITPIDGNYVKSNPGSLHNYAGFWSNSDTVPLSWNNEVAIDALANELSSGKRILLDNAGMLIAEFLGYGSVRQDSWLPGAVDGVYLVDFDSSHPILSDLPKWQNLQDYQSLSVPLDDNRCLWMTQGQGPWGVYYYYPSLDHPSSNQYFVGMYCAYGWAEMVNSTLDSIYGFNSVVANCGRILVNQYTAPLHRDSCMYCLFKEQTIGQGKIIVNGMGQHGPGLSKQCQYGSMGKNLILNQLNYVSGIDRLYGIGLLVNDVNALDPEEDAALKFAEGKGIHVVPIDGNNVNVNPDCLKIFNGYWCDSDGYPSSWNNNIALEALRSELALGKRIFLDNAGLYIAQFLGYGSVKESTWNPSAQDGAYLVDFTAHHSILSDITSWTDFQTLNQSRQLFQTSGDGSWAVYQYEPSAIHPSTDYSFVGLYVSWFWSEAINSTLDASYGFNSYSGSPGKILFNQYSPLVYDPVYKYCLFKEQEIGIGRIVVNGMGQHGMGLSKDSRYGQMGMELIARELRYVMGSNPGRTLSGPIIINNDLEFTAENGVIGGVGTSTDPYIIEGWEINASSSNYGISICNTTAYWQIRSCVVHHASIAAVRLYNEDNGILSNCFISNSSAGLLEDYSSINVLNCSFSHNSDGAFLRFSDSVFKNSSFANNVYGLALGVHNFDDERGGASAIIYGSEFLNNSITAGGSLDISNSRFQNGGVSFFGSGYDYDLEVVSCSFVGGGIGSTPTGGNIYVANSQFKNGGGISLNTDVIGTASGNTFENCTTCISGSVFTQITASNNVIRNCHTAFRFGSKASVSISNNDVRNCVQGIDSIFSTGIVTHNNFISAGAGEDGQSGYGWTVHLVWDGGYPSGGNYWGDYNGSDVFIGPGQNITGTDGIGDQPYGIPGTDNYGTYWNFSVDNYPFMNELDLSVPSNIADLNASLSGVDSAILHWTSPYKGSYSGNVSGYKVGWSTAGPIDELTWREANIITINTSKPPGTPDSIVVSRLPKNENVWFAIRAYDNFGILANLSNSPMVLTPAIPAAPYDVKTISGNKNVTLNWSIPFDGRLPISSYLVYRWNSTSSVRLIANITSNIYLDSGLTNGVTYGYYVTAYNQVGESTHSATVSAKPATTPSRPLSISVLPERSQVHVSWLSPADNGGEPILNYRVYRMEGQANEQLLRTVNTTGFDDLDLFDGIEYHYSISAVNLVGEGARSPWVSVIPGSTSVNLAIQCDASTAAFGFGVHITGNATHLLGGQSIPSLQLMLYYSVTSGASWNEITSVTTDANGSYSAWWTPSATGYYLVRAIWAGNSTLENSSTQVSLSVIQYSNNYVFSVESNSTVTSLAFDSTKMELRFTVSGPSGTMGYVRIMISKQLVANPEDIKLKFDGDQINYTLTERTDSWILMFTYYHSSHQIVAALTANTTPSAPLDLEAIPGNENMILSWSAPTYSNASAVTSYLLSYGGAIDATTNFIESSQLSYLLEGLTKGQTYYFKVAAKNDAGWGPNCTIIQSTAGGVPDAPKGLTAIAGHERVDLNWTAPSYTGSGVIYYHLFRDGTLIWNGTAGSYEDVEVTNGVTYSYKVAANNTIGWGPNCTAVQATPTSSDTAPSVPLGFMTIAGNENVTLNWTAPSYIGPGTITYHLYRDGSLIWTGAAITYLDMPLTKNVSYSYKVAAQNSIGWGSNCTEVLVIPYGVPDAPIGLNAIGGDGVVLLNWTAPIYLGPGSVMYHLFRDQVLIWNGTSLNYTDAAVTNGIRYTYEVSANNNEGWGENSTAVQATPMSTEQRPTAPRNLTATAGLENVTLAWDAPAFSNASVLSGYMISYGASPDSLSNQITWNQLIYVLNGLAKGKTYYFKVAAQNDAGWGPNSTMVTVTPFGLPDIPANMAAIEGVMQVSLYWDVPTYSGPGTLSYHLFRDGSVIWNGTDNHYVDSSVMANSTYSYNVAASNAVGWGMNSTEVQATPRLPEQKPTAPLNPVAIAGDGNITLRWDQPEFSNASAVVGYFIFYGTSIDSMTNQITWSQMTYILEGLTKGQIYYFIIAAQNSAGLGLNSTTVTATPFGVPSSTLGLTAKAGDSYVRLNWTVPIYLGPGTITYHLYRNSSLLWSGANLNYNDTTLLNAVTYSYKVAASNAVGWGLNGSIASATPMKPMVIPGTPRDPKVTPGDGQIVLSWTVPANNGGGSIEYRVYRGTTVDSLTLIHTGPATSYIDNDVEKNQVYHYKISAIGPAGESALTGDIVAFASTPAPPQDYTWILILCVVGSIAVIGAIWLLMRRKK